MLRAFAFMVSSPGRVTALETKFALIAVIIYYFLTESEVITGKSQTEALMY